jgi:hypothetical protein
LERRSGFVFPRHVTYTDFVEPTRIKPLSALPAAAVKAYLVRQGYDTDQILEWKYFDPAPDRGRERGLACPPSDRITAVISLIPFQVSDQGVLIESAWSCDWYRDPGIGGPVGMMLLQQSLAKSGRLYSFGGSESTQTILPRISQTVVPDAGIELHRPLRMGGVIRALARTANLRSVPILPFVDDIPLQRIGRAVPASKARLSSALISDIEPLLEIARTEDPHSCYGLTYLNWQLMRCPVLVSGVCTVPGDSTPRAAVFYWRLAKSTAFWRIAVISDRQAQEEVGLALTRVIQHVQSEHGWMISIVVSHLQKDLLELLNRKRFVAAKRRRPLYILNSDSKVAPAELKQLSYLDTDYAYRFPMSASFGRPIRGSL